MPARTFAIGDIHGCDVAFAHLIESIAPAADDRVVVLGDFVDRGPNSRGVVDQLLELQKACDLVVLLGNHEQALLQSLGAEEMLDIWKQIGGRETLESYGGEIDDIPQHHLAFISSARDYFETDTHIFVHANIDPRLALDQQKDEWLRWIHLTGFEQPHASGRTVICGHTLQRSGRPLVRNGWICLDTGGYAGKPLTCLELETGMCHRATQDGQVLPVEPLAAIAVDK